MQLQPSLYCVFFRCFWYRIRRFVVCVDSLSSCIFMRCYSHLSCALSAFCHRFIVFSLAFLHCRAYPLLILSLACLLSFDVLVAVVFFLTWYTLFRTFKCVIPSNGFHKHIYFIAWRFAHSFFFFFVGFSSSRTIIVRFIVGAISYDFKTKERL